MDMTTATTTSGLEGVVVADTRLSEVDGERGRLVVAGHDIERLATSAGFEDVVALLCDGALPDAAGREAQRVALAEGRALAFARLRGCGDALQLADGMDSLRASTGHLSEAAGFAADGQHAFVAQHVVAAPQQKIFHEAAHQPHVHRPARMQRIVERAGAKPAPWPPSPGHAGARARRSRARRSSPGPRRSTGASRGTPSTRPACPRPRRAP